ncbi:MAG TPA: rhomboid family intramembrane serine protease [Chthoniobacterales bacterium]|nr:rhomboid family intramembrane serine protease [Chthoniobacterales bacterium]
MRLSGRKSSSFTRRWRQRPRVVLLGLIGVNIAAFVTQLFLDAYQPGFIREYLGLSDLGIHAAYGWQFFTAPFLHSGPWHLFGNMLILYLLGRDVESIIGQRQFLMLYLAGAWAGELGHLFLMPETSVLFAASGGVAAVVVAYATILPELELTSMIFLVLPVRLKAKHLAYGAFAIAILGVTLDRSSTVAHSAYLGGCVAGWLYAHLLGFGRPSIFQRALRQRRAEMERYRMMTSEQFISEEVDPVLDKISREGLQSLTWSERRTLARAQEKIAEKAQAG